MDSINQVSTPLAPTQQPPPVQPPPPTQQPPVRLEGPVTSVTPLMPVSIPSVLGTQQVAPVAPVAPGAPAAPAAPAAPVAPGAPAAPVAPGAPAAPAAPEAVVPETEEEPGMFGGLLNNLIGETKSEEVPGQAQPQQTEVAPAPEQAPAPAPIPTTLPQPESQAQATSAEGGFLNNMFGQSQESIQPDQLNQTDQTGQIGQPSDIQQVQPLQQFTTGYTPPPVSYTFETPSPIQQELETSSFLPTESQPQPQPETSSNREYDLDIGENDEFLPDEEAEPLEDITFIDDQPPVLSTSVLPYQQQPSRIGAASIMGGAMDKIMRGEIYEGQPALESWSDLLPMWAWALIFFLLGAAFVGILYALTRPMEPEPQPLPPVPPGPPGPPGPPQPLPPVPPQPAPSANRKIYCLIGEDEGRRVVVRVSDASLCRRTVLLTDEEYENSL